MNAYAIFTRTRLGIDTRVWLSLLVALLLSGALFGFRIATTEACIDIAIVARNTENPAAVIFYTNDRLSFTAKANNNTDVAWDFGDNTIGKGARATHTYSAPGTYFVTATVNKKCREFISIIVRKQVLPSLPAGSDSRELSINGPDAPKAGEVVTFYTNITGDSYEWNVLNSPNYETQRIAVATYTFTNEGPQTIELKIDGKVVRKNIQVLPGDGKLPEPLPGPDPLPRQIMGSDAIPEAPVTAKAKILPPEEFTDMLRKVTKGDMNASSFDPYLCEGGAAATRVLLNDKNWTNLSAFCDKIAKNKKYNIRNTQVIRDENGCVKQLKVSYCKWVTLGLKCKEE
jgi:hypothetical protein